MKGLPEILRKRYRQFALGLAPLLPLMIVTLVSVYLLPVDGKDYEPPRAGGEFFPLSSFPMYATFDPKTYLVFLEDGEGNPVGVEAVLGLRSSALKKDYDRELRRLQDRIGKKHWEMSADEKKPAALDTLNHIVREYGDRHTAAKLTALELIDRRIFLRDGELVFETESIARIEIER